MSSQKYTKYFSGTNRIESWKSNGISEESIDNTTKSDSNFAPTFVNHHLLPDMFFNGQCSIKNNISKNLFRMLEKPKISYLLEKTLILSFICSKCKNEDEKIFKEEVRLRL